MGATALRSEPHDHNPAALKSAGPPPLPGLPDEVEARDPETDEGTPLGAAETSETANVADMADLDAKQESSGAEVGDTQGASPAATAAETDEFGPNFAASPGTGAHALDDVLTDVLELDSDDLIELGSQAQQRSEGVENGGRTPPPLQSEPSAADKPTNAGPQTQTENPTSSSTVFAESEEEGELELVELPSTHATELGTPSTTGPGQKNAVQSQAEGLAELLASPPDALPFQPRLEEGPRTPDEISLSPEAEQDLEELIEAQPLADEPPAREDTPQLRHADLYEDHEGPSELGPMSLASPQPAAADSIQPPAISEDAGGAEAEELVATAPLGLSTAEDTAPSAEAASLLSLANAPASASVDIVIIGDEGAGLGEFAELLADQCSAMRCDPSPEDAALAPEHPGIFRRSYAVRNKVFCDATQHLRSAQPLALFGIGLGSLALIVAGFFFSAPWTTAAGLFALAIEILVVRGHFMRKQFENGRVDLGVWQVSGEALANDSKTSAAIAQLLEARNDQRRPAHVGLLYLEDPLLLAPIRCHEAHQRRRRLKQSILALSRHFRERASGVDVRVLHCIERADMIQRLHQMFGEPQANADMTVGVIPRPAQVVDDLEALAPESGGYYLDLQELSRLATSCDDSTSPSQRRAASRIDADLSLSFDTSKATKLTELNHIDSLGGTEQAPGDLSHAMRAMLDRWELQCAIDPVPLRLVSYEYDRRARAQAGPALARVIRGCGSGLLRSGWAAS